VILWPGSIPDESVCWRLGEFNGLRILCATLMDSEIPLKTVLLVDPDRKFLRATKALLESKGYLVKTALNGKKIIEKVVLENPHIVLLNLKVPDLAGGELIKRIKQVDKKIAVIVTEPNGFVGREDLMKLGVTASFSKPIDSQNLLKVLEGAGQLPEDNKEKQMGMDSLLEKFLPFWAHEIRNPLQAIGGAMTIIERRSNGEDRALTQSISIVKEEVQTLTDFVQECLDYIKPPNRSHWGEININETLLLVLNLMPFMFKSLFDQISVITNFDPQLSKVYANYEEIKKVFLNIIKNAFESMIKSEKRELTIKTVNQGEWIDIIFADTGEGIKKEDIQFIGTPFFTTKLRGTGMGLVICNRIIVERHNGRLFIESQEGQGTTVTMKLPINQEKGFGGE
jgi:signal transduction histidine kinase